MTASQLLDQLKQLPTAERLEVAESALRQLREELAGDDLAARLARAARELRPDYVAGGELTVYRALDSEPFHV